MNDTDIKMDQETEDIIKEIISLERDYYFEKRFVKTERQKKLKEIIEKHIPFVDGSK